MPDVWELVKEASSLAFGTFWEHLNNLEGGGVSVVSDRYIDPEAVETIDSSLPIRSTLLKESIITWLLKQMKYRNGEYSEIGILSTYGENNNIPVILVSVGKEKIVTNKGNGIMKYDFWERERTYQVTKDYTIFVDVMANIDEESKTIAEILVDRMEVGPYRVSQGKLRIIKMFNDIDISPTKTKHLGREKMPLQMTRITFSVRTATIKVKKI